MLFTYMIAKDTVSLGGLFSDDSVLVHMTGHRQSKTEYLREIASGVLNYYSAQTDSIDITVDSISGSCDPGYDPAHPAGLPKAYTAGRKARP